MVALLDAMEIGLDGLLVLVLRLILAPRFEVVLAPRNGEDGLLLDLEFDFDGLLALVLRLGLELTVMLALVLRLGLELTMKLLLAPRFEVVLAPRK